MPAGVYPKKPQKRADHDHKYGAQFSRGGVSIFYSRAEDLYAKWPSPVCIVSDGPYGVSGFPGDEPTASSLAQWYKPHIEAWSRHSTPQTTLWFWNTEVGWATVHPVLVDNGWEYRCCHIWDKGLSHVAGNANSATLRKFPVITEACVQYVKAALFELNGRRMSMQQWLRHEWLRTGLPLRLSNKACGVLNAATRKYLTSDHLWYYPPPETFERMAFYANRHGKPEGRPYFSLDGKRPISAFEWSKLRAKFKCDVGINNIWREPPVRGAERIQGTREQMKWKFSSLHGSQKPLQLVNITLRACTDPGDIVWEPFGGLCTAAISAHLLGRKCVSAEIVPEFFLAAVERLAHCEANGVANGSLF